MFGYITIDRAELKGKDLDLYQAFYCGVCQDLKKICGQMSRMTLTYDMTFLALVLSGLCERDQSGQEAFCILHPLRRRTCVRNDCTGYAADMNLMLVYHNLEDDWLDDKKAASRLAAWGLGPAYRRLAGRYPRQKAAIETYLDRLHAAEEARVESIDHAAGLTGELMEVIYSGMEEGEAGLWKSELGELGYAMGRFLYLMDAWDDLEEDRKRQNYNPFLHLEGDRTDQAAETALLAAAGDAARAFERLPLLQNADIIRNVLYSGMWLKYRIKKEKKKEKHV